jgi:fatty acid kinase fatty acid binding subunit
MPQVRIATDSAADIPPDLVAALGIAVAPLSIHFGDTTYLDGETITPAEFYQVMAGSPHFPRTSQPSVGRFEQIYAKARDDGMDVVSIHIASTLSGTFNAAQLAANNVEGARVHLVDSQTASMAEGELVLAAARLAAEDIPAAEIVQRIEELRPAVHPYIMLDSLAHLQRGGRISRVQGLLGTLLSVKPIIEVTRGELIAVQRVRTSSKALQELANNARGQQPLAGLRVLHSNAPKLVEGLLDLLKPLVPGREIPVQLLGPVVGVHVGAGAIGVVTLQEQKR